MLKRFKYALMLNLLPPLIYLFLLCLKGVSKIRYVYGDSFRAIVERGENVIICFWHGRLLMMPFANLRARARCS